MRCMYCGYTESKVVDSRPTDDGWAIRRRRECMKCGKRFTTYEKVDNPMVLVVKKDGRREAFDAEKIRRGLIRASEKRPVSAQDIENLVAEVEKQVYNYQYPDWRDGHGKTARAGSGGLCAFCLGLPRVPGHQHLPGRAQ